MVEVKKNKTMNWYQELPHEQKHAVTKLAVKQRGVVINQYRKEERERIRLRQERMKQCHKKREAMKEKTARKRSTFS